jgi:hypothetical protein
MEHVNETHSFTTKMISPLGERIKYLPKVGPCADTFAPKRWSLTKNVNALIDASGPVGPYNSLG